MRPPWPLRRACAVHNRASPLPLPHAPTDSNSQTGGWSCAAHLPKTYPFLEGGRQKEKGDGPCVMSCILILHHLMRVEFPTETRCRLGRESETRRQWGLGCIQYSVSRNTCQFCEINLELIDGRQLAFATIAMVWSGLVWSGRAMDPTKGNTTAISSFTTGGPSLELTYLRRFVLVELDLRLS